MNEPAKNQSSQKADSKVKIKNFRRSSQPRAGWAEAFAMMAQNRDDVLLDHFVSTEWDQFNWE